MTVKITKPKINIREKLSELDKPSGIAGQAMLRAEAPQEQFNLIGAGRKNIFINGAFTVSQRGDFTSATATSAQSYGLDRWTNYLSGVSATYQNTTVTIDGVTRKALKMAATSSATGYFGPVQHVELSAFRAGVPLTMSGYVRTNNPNVYFRHDYIGGVTGIQAPDRIPPDGNWHYVTWTVDTTGTSTIPIFQVLAYNYGSISVTNGDYIEIADMQLEVGKVATPFEHRSYGEELALCQRYYYRITNNYAVNQNLCMGVVADSDDVFGVMNMPVTMRAPPTVTASAAASFRVTTVFGSGSSQNCSQLVLGYDGLTHVTIKARGNGGGFTAGEAKLIGFNETVGLAHIAFDAEI